MRTDRFFSISAIAGNSSIYETEKDTVISSRVYSTGESGHGALAGFLEGASEWTPSSAAVSAPAHGQHLMNWESAFIRVSREQRMRVWTSCLQAAWIIIRHNLMQSSSRGWT